MINVNRYWIQKALWLCLQTTSIAEARKAGYIYHLVVGSRYMSRPLHGRYLIEWKWFRFITTSLYWLGQTELYACTPQRAKKHCYLTYRSFLSISTKWKPDQNVTVVDGKLIPLITVVHAFLYMQICGKSWNQFNFYSLNKWKKKMTNFRFLQ